MEVALSLLRAVAFLEVTGMLDNIGKGSVVMSFCRKSRVKFGE